ncbi:MAG: leucyl aminopeptidase, partial [Rhodospirillales bacterium]|nr:leucyl aminopeptidase [Rhodospirillales bacterium]
MKISFVKAALPSEGALVVGVLEGRKLTPGARELDQKTGGALTRAMAASRFEGKGEQTLLLLAPANLEISRLLLVGLGKAEELDAQKAQS